MSNLSRSDCLTLSIFYIESRGNTKKRIIVLTEQFEEITFAIKE